MEPVLPNGKYLQQREPDRFAYRSLEPYAAAHVLDTSFLHTHFPRAVITIRRCLVRITITKCFALFRPALKNLCSSSRAFILLLPVGLTGANMF